MNQTDITRANGLENRLDSLAKFPHFFAPPPQGRRPSDIDALPIILDLQDITDYVDRRMLVRKDTEDYFTAGSASRLFAAVIDLHVVSFSGKVEKTPQDGTSPLAFMSSWSGICSAMGLYLHSILGVWNGGRPMSSRMLVRIIQILKRHLTRDQQRLGKDGGLDRGFWFWKTFVGAMALATQRYSMASGSSAPGLPVSSPDSRSSCKAMDDVKMLEEWFILSIKKWSRMADVKTWEDARAVLARVVWPASISSEPLAISLWRRAIEGRT